MAMPILMEAAPIAIIQKETIKKSICVTYGETITETQNKHTYTQSKDIHRKSMTHRRTRKTVKENKHTRKLNDLNNFKGPHGNM